MPAEIHLVELTVLQGARYSITLGYLQAAVLADADLARQCTFQRHIHNLGVTSAYEKTMAAMDDPFVVALTIYFWNRPQSLELARQVKARWPHCIIVVGGVDVSYQTDALFTDAPWVDVLVHGEGELRFAALLRLLLDGGRDLSSVPGVSFWSDGAVVTTAPPARITELEDVPSPILSAVYPDADITATQLIVYETNRGCPYGCAFCYWGGATNSKVRQFSLDRIRAELDRLVPLMRAGAALFIADANFGILGRDLEIAQHIVELCQRHDKKLEVTTNWAKNSNERIVNIAKLFHDHDLTTAITLSAQSFDPEVLTIANRSNIRVENYRRLQARFRELEIPTYTDLIWGLPGESLDSYRNSIEEALLTGGSPVMYPLLLLNNTEYTHARFRRDHALVARQAPADPSNPALVADVVVSHDRMSVDEWVRGMTLRLPLVLFQKCLLRCALRVIHRLTGRRIVDLCETLWDFLRDASPDPVVGLLAANYEESWHDAKTFNWALVTMELGRSAIPEELHYQAILHRVVADPDKLHEFLLAAVSHLGVDDELIDVALQIDEAAATVFRTTLTSRPEAAEFDAPASALELLRDAGEVPWHVVPEGARTVGSIRPAAKWIHCPFTVYALSVWHGAGRPLYDAEITLHTPALP